MSAPNSTYRRTTDSPQRSAKGDITKEDVIEPAQLRPNDKPARARSFQVFSLRGLDQELTRADSTIKYFLERSDPCGAKVSLLIP